MSRQRRGATPRRRWQPLQPAGWDPDAHSRRDPDGARTGGYRPSRAYRNDRYTVFVYEHPTPDFDTPVLHLSIHRHDREPIRDWRHLQAIKNEVAGVERTAIEVFPPESQLIDEANEYHLWVMPVGFTLPFVVPQRRVGTHADGLAEFGPSKARQREWEPGISTGLGLAFELEGRPSSMAPTEPTLRRVRT